MSEEVKTDHSPEIICDEGDFIVKAFTVGDPQVMSKQLRDEGDNPFADDDVIDPPFDPLIWALLLERNTRLNRLVHTYARNTVGLGWEIIPKSTLTQEEVDKNKTAIDAEIKILSVLFDRPNELMPFVTMMNLIKIDQEATGNGYMEVIREGTKITKLYHVPATTIGIRKRGRGFVQERGNDKRYFKCFGDDKHSLHSETGFFDDDEKGVAVPLDKLASEILHFKIYSPRSSFYGIPRHVSASPAIAGSRFAAERNMSFFHNDAVPRMAVLVSGGQLDAISIEHIERFFKKKGQGPQNAHRVMVVQAEPKTAGVMNENKTKIELVPLTVGGTDDASFQKYREMNDEEVREAFGIAKIFLGTMDDVNRASAMTGRQITNEQEFEPDRIELEYTFNNRILAELDPQWTEFRFKRPRTAFKADLAEPNKDLAQAGALAPNDIRKELGLPLYDVEKFPWAAIPVPIALQQLRNEQAEILAGAGSANQNGNANNNGAKKNNDKNEDIPNQDKDMTRFMNIISDKEGEIN